MIETIKVSSRGQVVIPERVREELAIEEGTTLILVEDSGRIILEKEVDFLKKIHRDEERKSWIALGEKAFAKVWDNPEDDRTWSKY
ncbi:AbrB/MazE/SpoVT family DNA-binding domain-containing protein [Candidatus Woesearchaeota archaeon]|nr:AbrB/MazE/SpoVT family DNA-binding domain-containing protein [Candidatus Woesearchaeota archaeon]